MLQIPVSIRQSKRVWGLREGVQDKRTKPQEICILLNLGKNINAKTTFNYIYLYCISEGNDKQNTKNDIKVG